MSKGQKGDKIVSSDWSKEAEQKLTEYRIAIDTIDDEILALLAKRNEVVDNVGKLKAEFTSERSIIRPGREANMVRRIAEKSSSGLSSVALAMMWRLIISSSINIEEDARVSAYSSAHNRECYWLSREHFGAFTAMQEHPTTMEVLRDVLERKSTVGVVPLEPLEEKGSQPWWSRITQEENPPHIFATLPFIQMAPSDKTPLVAFGYVTPEDTGHDASYWVLKSPAKVLFSMLGEKLKAAGITVEVMDHCQVLGVVSYEHYLLKIDGFMAEGHEKVLAFVEDADAAFQVVDNHVEMHYLGSFAKPIEFAGVSR